MGVATKGGRGVGVTCSPPPPSVKSGGRRGRPAVVVAFSTFLTGIYNLNMEKDPFEQRVDQIRRVLILGLVLVGPGLGPYPSAQKSVVTPLHRR